MINDYFDDKLKVEKTNILLAEIHERIVVESINLRVKDGIYTHDLYDYLNAGMKGEFQKIRLFASIAIKQQIDKDITMMSQELMRIIAYGNDSQSSYRPKYEYATFLIESQQNISDGIKLLQFLLESNYSPAVCRIGVYKMVGINGFIQDLFGAKKLFLAASKNGHVRSRIFLTRMKKKYGNVFEKLTWPFFMFSDIIYTIRIGPSPADETLLLY